MKKFRIGVLLLSTIALLSSCDNSLKSKIMGKWRIAEMKIQYYEQQEELGNAQIKMLKDSLAVTTDSAKVGYINSQIAQIENQIHSFKAQQDSAMKKSSWEFKPKGEFVANEAEGAKNGVWSYDPELNMLFTVIDKQASSVTVKFEKDTMILQLDSVNYMKFAPLKP